MSESISLDAGPSQPGLTILDDLVTIEGIPVHLYYNHGQLLQAENEYNKAALLPTTLDEYKQVLDRNPPGKNY